MLFKMQNEVIFRGYKQLTSKKDGNPFYIVKISDPVGYETLDFFPENPADFVDIKPNSKIKVGYEYDGKFGSLVLIK